VALVDIHHQVYIAIMMQNVDDKGQRLSHTHSIVFKVGGPSTQFHMENFLEFLASTHLSNCAEEFMNLFWPWHQSVPKTKLEK